MAMAPANLFSMIPTILELSARFRVSVDFDAIRKDVQDDIEQVAIDTTPAVFRGLMKPRKTIIAVPAATTRPFDHHIFGEAGAKAAGLVTVFTNLGGRNGGQSCFIGHYKTNSLEGSSVRGLQSPYHGCAPGIWTWKYPGGAVLGASETALVVADVNPVDTNASKPARQIETLPLSLVAHIPFFLGAESGGKDEVQARAVKSAQEILAYLTPPDASLAGASPLSTCETDLATAHVARGIAERLAQVDKRCEDSLRLRSGGLRVASMQPHSHPGIPALLDWAFIAAPTKGVEIEVPEIEAIEVESLSHQPEITVQE